MVLVSFQPIISVARAPQTGSLNNTPVPAAANFANTLHSARLQLRISRGNSSWSRPQPNANRLRQSKTGSNGLNAGLEASLNLCLKRLLASNTPHQQRLTLPLASEPLVSILVPMHEQLLATAAGLRWAPCRGLVATAIQHGLDHRRCDAEITCMQVSEYLPG